MNRTGRIAAVGLVVAIVLLSGCCWGRWWDRDGGGRRHGEADLRY